MPDVAPPTRQAIRRLATLHPDAPSTVQVAMYFQGALLMTAEAFLTADTMTLHAQVQQYGIVRMAGPITATALALGK